MVVGNDVGRLVDWAVGFQASVEERPTPRIGIHYGITLYRDGDYFGRDVNLAARVVARARGGEVLVTDAVMAAVSRRAAPEFEDIGEVKLKGFDEPRELCRAVRPGGMSERPLEAARDSGLVPAGEPLLVLLSGGGDSVCLLDVALPPRRGRVRAARELRAARRCAARTRSSCAALCERLGVPLHAERLELPDEATCRNGRARRATRWPSRSPTATTPPPIPRPTRPRPFSTGSPSRPARGRCSAWRRAAAGWCARCWR